MIEKNQPEQLLYALTLVEEYIADDVPFTPFEHEARYDLAKRGQDCIDFLDGEAEKLKLVRDAESPTRSGWWQDVINTETITYTAATATAFSVFVRNVIGVAKDWRDLHSGRKIIAIWAGKPVMVKEGDDLQELTDKLRGGA
jgi:hypothetical protein